MRTCFIFLFLVTYFQISFGQVDSLFDNSRVNTIKIQIHPDSLAYLYSNLTSTQYLKAKMVFGNEDWTDSISDIGFRLRGNTSRFAAKKSFKISFNEFVSGRRYRKVKKLNLNGQHNDPTMIREKLFYEVWNKAGMKNRRTAFFKLYINGQYYGLYTGLEEFDKDWLKRVFPENNGNLYKCTYPADLAYLGQNQQLYKNIFSGSATGGRAYSLETNEAVDDYTFFVKLITKINTTSTAQIPVVADSILNINGFLKAYALDIATGNWDNYGYNKNNYFLYHNLQTGRFEFISYDTDNTFGIDWVNKDWATRNCSTWESSEPRPLVKKLLASPFLRNRFYAYLDTMTRYFTNPDSLNPRIDYLKSLITPAAAADTYRSLDYGYTMASFNLGFTGTVDTHSPYGIKPFLSTRYQNTLSQLAVLTFIQTEDLTIQPRLWPNPCHNYIIASSKNPEKEIQGIKLKDISGKEVWIEKEIDLYQIKLDVKGLKPGVYFLYGLSLKPVQIIKQ